MNMKEASALFRLLGDEVRLRILRLLAAERLNVTELTGILGIAQSGVSRHLGMLRESGLVEEQREGGFSYYRVPAAEARNGTAPLWPLLDAQFAASADDWVARADQARLKEVLRLRKESFANHGDGQQLVPGPQLGRLGARARAPAAGVGRRRSRMRRGVSHGRGRPLGTPRGRRRPVCRRARARERAGAPPRRLEHRVEAGRARALPLEDGSVDVALLSQALHHAADPARALAEGARVTRAGGRVLVLDLRRHDETWVQERLGDRWLGFDDGAAREVVEGRRA